MFLLLFSVVRGYLGSPIKVACSVARRFAHSLTQCLATKTVFSFLQIFFWRRRRPAANLEATDTTEHAGETERKSTVRQLSAYSGGTKFSLPSAQHVRT